jgi:hypothetical protein
VQILQMTTLAEVEDILPKETMAISDWMWSLATCANMAPTASSVMPSVPEEHTGVTTMFEHLNSHPAPPTVNMPRSLPIAPTVQPVIVNCVPVVNPQLTSIIRYDAPSVMARSEDSHVRCPTHSEMISSAETRPIATSISVVDT